MLILGIDPGPEFSACVLYDRERRRILEQGDHLPNLTVLTGLVRARGWQQDWVVIERIRGYGMPVGAEVFETAEWSGRFCEAAQANRQPVGWVERREVKLYLCGDSRAKDANVRQALLDRFGPSREKAIGTKKAPGPLYGIKGDAWSALAVAVTAAERITGTGKARTRAPDRSGRTGHRGAPGREGSPVQGGVVSRLADAVLESLRETPPGRDCGTALPPLTLDPDPT